MADAPTQLATTKLNPESLADRASRAALAERASKAADADTASVPAGLARSFGQGALFGFADEAEAAVRAIWDTAPDEDFSDAYLRLRSRARDELEQFRSERPALALGAEILGGFAVPGVGVGAGVVRAATTGGRVLRGAAGGAASGALFGAGIAEEAEDIPREMAVGAGLGLAAGIALPGAVAGGRRVLAAGQAALAPQRAATRRIGQAIARDDMTPEQIAGALDEAQRLGKPAKVVDVGGESLQRELETAVQSPGAAAQIAERILAPRNKEQLTRLSRDLVRGTDIAADVVEDAIEKTMRIRSNAARPVYKRAMDFPAELNDDIVETYQAAIKTPLGKEALKKARKILNLPTERRTIIGRDLKTKEVTVDLFDEAPLMERIDAFKRGLDDVIESSKRSGNKAIARKAQEVKRELLELVDAVNPDYKKARQIWENSSRYLDSINRGRDILKPQFTAALLSREFKKMSAVDQEAFRLGAVDAIITRMRQQSAKEPNLLRIIRSAEIRDKLKTILTPKRAAELDKILDIEESMFRTASQARGGSATARRTAAQLEQNKQLSFFSGVDILLSLPITAMRSVFLKAIPAISRSARERLLAKQNAIIAKRLLSADPDELLKIPLNAGPPPVAGGSAIPAVDILGRSTQAVAAIALADGESP